jgi:hypothetical protein
MSDDKPPSGEGNDGVSDAHRHAQHGVPTHARSLPAHHPRGVASQAGNRRPHDSPAGPRIMSERAGSSVVGVAGSPSIYVSQPAAVASFIERTASAMTSGGRQDAVPTGLAPQVAELSYHSVTSVGLNRPW